MAEDLVNGWSCDQRRRGDGCRDPHGCHCREITAQAASLAAKDKEIERLREQARRDREYSSSQARQHAKLVNLVLAAESRAEQAERVFTDLCEELGCKPDNEAALEAVAALKRALAEAVEVLRPLVSHTGRFDAWSGHPGSDNFPLQLVHAEGDAHFDLTLGELRAARAFVAQHGSDSSTER